MKLKLTRERIITLIGESPRTAQTLAKELGITVSSVCDHLQKIKATGPNIGFSLVREGKRGIASKAWFLVGGSHAP